MKLNGSFMIQASVEEVWDVLMDPEKLAGCVPGVESIRVLSPTRYEADMTVKVQFLPIRFKAQGELKEAVEHQSLVVEIEGEPLSLAGQLRNRLALQVLPQSAEQTGVSYEMDVHMTGKLASIGAMLAKGTVTKTAQEFADNVVQLFNDPLRNKSKPVSK